MGASIIAIRGPVPWTIALLLLIAEVALLVRLVRARRHPVLIGYLFAAQFPSVSLYLFTRGSWAVDGREWFVSALHVLLGWEACWIALRRRPDTPWAIGYVQVFAVLAAALFAVYVGPGHVAEQWLAPYFLRTGAVVYASAVGLLAAAYAGLFGKRRPGIWYALAVGVFFAGDWGGNAIYRVFPATPENVRWMWAGVHAVHLGVVLWWLTQKKEQKK